MTFIQTIHSQKTEDHHPREEGFRGSLADEMIAALIEENKKLRDQLSTSQGLSSRVIHSQIPVYEKRLHQAEQKADALENSSRNLQQKIDQMKKELSQLADNKNFEIDVSWEDFTPPSKPPETTPQRDPCDATPEEANTQKLCALQQKIAHAEDRVAYYTNLPAKAEELRGALTLAKQACLGNETTFFPETEGLLSLMLLMIDL